MGVKKAKNQKRQKRQNGTGSFSTKPNGKIMLRLNYGTRENGTPRILTVSGRTQKECNILMKAKITEIDEKDNIKGEFWGALSLTELCRRHFRAKLEKKGTLKPKSADREESTINNHIEKYPIGSLQVETITSKDIERHYESLFKRYAPSTVQKVFVKINEAYEWAMWDFHLTNNPCTRIKKMFYERFNKLEAHHKAVRGVIVLTEKQLDIFKMEATKLCKNSKPKYEHGYAGLFLVEVGIRVGELCALVWADWDRDNHTLRITKTRGIAKDRDAITGEPIYIAQEGTSKTDIPRIIELSPEAEKWLEKIWSHSKHTNPDDYIILNRNQKPTEAGGFGKTLNTIFRNANLPPEISGCHVLRRTFATKLYMAGYKDSMIATYIGDTLETLLKYYVCNCKVVEVGTKTLNVIPLPKEELGT